MENKDHLIELYQKHRNSTCYCLVCGNQNYNLFKTNKKGLESEIYYCLIPFCKDCYNLINNYMAENELCFAGIVNTINILFQFSLAECESVLFPYLTREEINRYKEGKIKITKPEPQKPIDLTEVPF